MAETKQPQVKYLVRIANTDLTGSKPSLYALSKVKGVSIMLANCLCELANIPKDQKIGTLSDAQVQKINDILANPVGLIPEWMLNRRRDPETNEANHILGPTLKFIQDNDVKLMRKIKSYKGIRHSHGLPVRGQRTKSNFRKSKSRGKGALGVKRKGK